MGHIIDLTATTRGEPGRSPSMRDANIIAARDAALTYGEITNLYAITEGVVSGVLRRWGRCKAAVRVGSQSIEGHLGPAHERLTDARQRLAFLYGDPDARIAENAPDVALWRGLGQ